MTNAFWLAKLTGAIVIAFVAAAPAGCLASYFFARRRVGRKPSSHWFLVFLFPVVMLLLALVTASEVPFYVASAASVGSAIAWIISRLRNPER
jgi:hypothetical protein